jgi:hypothetical protein
LEQPGKGVSQPINLLELIRVRPRAAGKADLLVPRHDFKHVAGKLAARAPQVNLKGERVASWLLVDHASQRRVRDETAVPVMLAFDLDRRKTRRQRSAGPHVFGPDGVRCRVEIDEITRPDIDRAGAEADRAGIEAIEVDESFQRAFQIARVIEAGRLDRSARLKPW